MLHPEAAARTAELAAAWRQDPLLRIEPFLRDEVVRELRDELRLLPHAIVEEMGAQLTFLCFRYAAPPDPHCEHVVCELGRWLFSEGRAWIGEITGRVLAPPPDNLLVSTVYGKGCYLDPHSDTIEDRSVAYVLGLTETRWPPEEGGWLEFLEPQGGARVSHRRAPGWNTLDVFDVETSARVHQIPLVTAHHERRAISGWLHRPR